MENLRYFDISGSNIAATHECYKQIEQEGFRLHSHDSWELIYLKNGSISYFSEGRRYDVENGSCILTPPGIRHTIGFRDKTIYDRYVISLNSPLFDTLPELPEVINPGNSQIVQELFHKMDFYTTYLEGELLETILLRLTEEALLNFKIISHQLPENYTANPIITQAVSYISEHLQEQISLDSLCAHLHITKSYLHRLFLEHLQLSPGRFITIKRLEQARMDIRSGSRPAKVYNLWGFQDYCTFYRNYVRHFGYPPSEEQGRPSAPKIEW